MKIPSVNKYDKIMYLDTNVNGTFVYSELKYNFITTKESFETKIQQHLAE